MARMRRGCRCTCSCIGGAGAAEKEYEESWVYQTKRGGKCSDVDRAYGWRTATRPEMEAVDALRSHVDAILRGARGDRREVGWIRIANRLGRHLRNRAKYGEALRLFEEGVTAAEQLVRRIHPQLGRASPIWRSCIKIWVDSMLRVRCSSALSLSPTDGSTWPSQRRHYSLKPGDDEQDDGAACLCP